MQSKQVIFDTNYTTIPIPANEPSASSAPAIPATAVTKHQLHQEQQGAFISKRTNSTSTDPSYSHRDSRVNSIYDRYLYRQESQKRAQDPPLSSKQSINKALKTVDHSKNMSSTSRSASSPAMTALKKKRQSGFRKDNRESRPEQSAWAGMMMGNVSSDDSDTDDSDNEATARVPSPNVTSKKLNTEKQSRASWSSRAVAVGSRPPDSASQNPPTLKLMGLRSVKEGGAPMGHGNNQPSNRLQIDPQQSRSASSPASDRQYKQGTPMQKDSIISTSDYGDDVGRHGSYIEFGGAAVQSRQSNQRGYQLEDGPVNLVSSSLEPRKQSSPNRPSNPRTALTQQLGLVTPQPSPPREAKKMNSQSPGRKDRSDGFFPPTMASANQDYQRNLTAGGHNRQQQQRTVSPRTLSPAVSPSSSSQSIALQRGAPALSGPISPFEQGMPRATTNQMRAAPAPMPIPLPSPVYPPSYHSEAPNTDSRMSPNPGPGFSETPQGTGRQLARRQPSMLRRSMAFITGSGPMLVQEQQQNGVDGKRRSLFRRSLAILTGRPAPTAQYPLALVDDQCHSPLPRVAGFIDEKPKNRKSEYLGASGMGDEWDYSGNGAKFWKRFSMAQRKETEGAYKESEAFRKKMARRHRRIMFLSLLGGLCIIGGVVGTIIWRSTMTTSGTPGVIGKQAVDAIALPSTTHVNNDLVSTTTTPSTTTAAETSTVADSGATTTAITTHHHHNNNKRRAVQEVDMIKREIENGAPSYFGGVHPLPRSLQNGKMRRRKLGSGQSLKARSTPAPHLHA